MTDEELQAIRSRVEDDWWNEDHDMRQSCRDRDALLAEVARLRNAYSDGDDVYPCTCTAACPPSCTGKCGCRACHMHYGDFLSSE